MEFGIYRIVGNELWPRDYYNSKFFTLEYILNNEPPLESSDKIWILNRLYNRSYAKLILDLIEAKKQKVLIIPFDYEYYKKLNSAKSKVHYATAVNEARNFALTNGREKYKYTFILDGDCYFTKCQWDNIKSKIFHNDTRDIKKDYYSLPVIRTHIKSGALRYVRSKPIKEESQLCFHKSTKVFFNENIEFGKNDKAELLNRLSFKKSKIFQNYYCPTSKECEELSEIYHFASTGVFFERYGELRRIVRFASKFLLAHKIKQNLG